jgi:hypothetical protein
MTVAEVGKYGQVSKLGVKCVWFADKAVVEYVFSPESVELSASG